TGPGTIGRADLDGQNVDPDLVNVPGNACGVAVDEAHGHIYWGSCEGAKIGRADLDGSNQDPDFLTNVGYPCGVAVGGGRLYWASWTDPADPIGFFQASGDGAIGRANLDGSDPVRKFIPDASPKPCGLAVDSAFTLETAVRNKRSGTALLPAEVPGRGMLTLSGRGLQPRRLDVSN